MGWLSRLKLLLFCNKITMNKINDVFLIHVLYNSAVEIQIRFTNYFKNELTTLLKNKVLQMHVSIPLCCYNRSKCTRFHILYISLGCTFLKSKLEMRLLIFLCFGKYNIQKLPNFWFSLHFLSFAKVSELCEIWVKCQASG